MLRLTIVLAVMFGAGSAHGEMLFTTLDGHTSYTTSNTPSMPMIEVIMSQFRHDRWELPISAGDVGRTFIGTRSTMGESVFFAMNDTLTNGVCCGADVGVRLMSELGSNTSGVGDKSLLWNDGTPVPSVSIDSNFTPANGFDMNGYHLTRLELIVDSFTIGTLNSLEYRLRIFGDVGQVLEPSAALLMIVGFFYHAPNWRTYRRRIV